MATYRLCLLLEPVAKSLGENCPTHLSYDWSGGDPRLCKYIEIAFHPDHAPVRATPISNIGVVTRGGWDTVIVDLFIPEEFAQHIRSPVISAIFLQEMKERGWKSSAK